MYVLPALNGSSSFRLEVPFSATFKPTNQYKHSDKIANVRCVADAERFIYISQTMRKEKV